MVMSSSPERVLLAREEAPQHLSSQQEKALLKVIRWFDDDDASRVFRLSGYAGIGKTTVAAAISTEIRGVKFAALTGKLVAAPQ
jgi:flagellar biosynthesis GTPase FlhF